MQPHAAATSQQTLGRPCLLQSCLPRAGNAACMETKLLCKHRCMACRRRRLTAHCRNLNTQRGVIRAPGSAQQLHPRNLDQRCPSMSRSGHGCQCAKSLTGTRGPLQQCLSSNMSLCSALELPSLSSMLPHPPYTPSYAHIYTYVHPRTHSHLKGIYLQVGSIAHTASTGEAVVGAICGGIFTGVQRVQQHTNGVGIRPGVGVGVSIHPQRPRPGQADFDVQWGLVARDCYGHCPDRCLSIIKRKLTCVELHKSQMRTQNKQGQAAMVARDHVPGCGC